MTVTVASLVVLTAVVASRRLLSPWPSRQAFSRLCPPLPIVLVVDPAVTALEVQSPSRLDFVCWNPRFRHFKSNSNVPQALGPESSFWKGHVEVQHSINILRGSQVLRKVMFGIIVRSFVSLLPTVRSPCHAAWLLQLLSPELGVQVVIFSASRSMESPKRLRITTAWQ